jgi:hypothetical protein
MWPNRAERTNVPTFYIAGSAFRARGKLTDMSAFEVVLIIVAVLGIGAACTGYFRSRNVIKELGDSPRGFAHPEERPVSEQPSEDTRDEPLPKRPMRGRA